MIIGSQLNEGVMVVNTDTRVYTIRAESHPNYARIREALIAEDLETAEGLLDIEQMVSKFGDGALLVMNGKVEYKGRTLAGVLERYILRMIEEKHNVSPMLAFLDNLYQNPSKNSVDQLFTFLEANMMPLTPDGYFLGYKFVTKDYLDCHTRSISNKPGERVWMDRNEVEDDKNVLCASGLHVCSLPYIKMCLRNSSDLRAMVTKVNPRDVVSVPTDYKNTKMRVCEYVVLSELDREKFDFSDPDFQGAFDGIVENGDNTVPAESVSDDVNKLTAYDLGFQHGQNSKNCPGTTMYTYVPRAANGRFDAQSFEYFKGYKAGKAASEAKAVEQKEAVVSIYDVGFEHGVKSKADATITKYRFCPRNGKGQFDARSSEYLKGFKAGQATSEQNVKEWKQALLEAANKANAEMKSPPSSWPSDEQVLAYVPKDENDQPAVYLLGMKHGCIARARGSEFKPAGAYKDNTDYQTGYFRGFKGLMDYNYGTFDEYWKDLNN